jgi:type II secretory pathway pseudopilin PulG
MDVLQDVFALFVLFAITLVIVLTLLSIATGFASLGFQRGKEKGQPQAEADDTEAARAAARQAAQEQETREV